MLLRSGKRKEFEGAAEWDQATPAPPIWVRVVLGLAVIPAILFLILLVYEFWKNHPLYWLGAPAASFWILSYLNRPRRLSRREAALAVSAFLSAGIGYAHGEYLEEREAEKNR